MKAQRWTAQDVKLQAESQLASQQLAVAEVRLKKLRTVLIIEGASIVPVAVLAGLVRFEAGAIAAALGVIGLCICIYYWSQARQQANVATVALETNKSERKTWARQRPKELA